MNKKVWTAVVGLFLLYGCGSMARYGSTQERETVYGKNPPVITEAYASPTARPGNTWKVYLKANDPNGDMKAIFSVIEQPGVGNYSPSITRIKPEDRKEMNGYLFLNTAGQTEILHLINITLRVEIQDMAGHFSAPVVFPLSFNNTYSQQPPPPGVFQAHELGPIMIQLRTTGDGERREH